MVVGMWSRFYFWLFLLHRKTQNEKCTVNTTVGEARHRLDHLRLITVELTKTRPLYPKTTQEQSQREEEFQSLFFFKKRLNIGRTADDA